jgi:hypothetical protein
VRAILICRDPAQSYPAQARLVNSAVSHHALPFSALGRQAFRLPGRYMDAQGVMPAM